MKSLLLVKIDCETRQARIEFVLQTLLLLCSGDGGELHFLVWEVQTSPKASLGVAGSTRTGAVPGNWGEKDPV